MVIYLCFRLREERGDAERALALDHKPRDLSSHNGQYKIAIINIYSGDCIKRKK